MPNRPKVRFCTTHPRHKLSKRGHCWMCHSLQDRLRHGGHLSGAAVGTTKARHGVKNGKRRALRSNYRS
eukprot:1240854-Pyramimonas_sp.AAC.1